MTNRPVDPRKRRGSLLRFFWVCLGTAAVGAAMAFSAGSDGESRIGIAGALLGLVGIVAGMVTLLLGFVLDIARIGPFLKSLTAGRDHIRSVRPEKNTALWEESDLHANWNVRLVAVVGLVIVLINVAVIWFLFSPVSRNPRAILIVGLVGGITAISLLFVPNVRRWLGKFLTARDG